MLVRALDDADDRQGDGVGPPYRQIARRVQRGMQERDHPVRAGWWLGTAWQLSLGAEPVSSAIDLLAEELELPDSWAPLSGPDPVRCAFDKVASFLDVRRI